MKNQITLIKLIMIGFLWIFSKATVEASASKADSNEEYCFPSSTRNLTSLQEESIKQAIDEYFKTENSSQEKIVKRMQMELKEETGMKIEVILDRNSINKAIDGAYVYQGEDGLKIEFKQSVSNPAASLITKSDLDEMSKYFLKKIFAYDSNLDQFKVLRHSDFPDYKGIYTHVQELQIHDYLPISDFKNTDSIDIIAEFFKEEEGAPEMLLISPENAKDLFEIGLYKAEAHLPEEPALMGYYTQAAIIDNKAIFSILKTVFSLEHVSYPANNRKDGSYGIEGTEAINAGLFPVSVFEENTGEISNDNPYLYMKGVSEALKSFLIQFYMHRMIDVMQHDFIINQNDDLQLTFLLSSEEMIKAFGGAENYKGKKTK